MFAPDYAHWHGTFEVAERFYQQLIPQAREIARLAEEGGQKNEAEAVRKVIEEVLARPEHKWLDQAKIKPLTTATGGDVPAISLAGD
jgi:hypothetical protein